MNNIESNNKMNEYLATLYVRSDLLFALKLFSNGAGFQLGEIMPIFGDSPDLDDCPELIDFEGVGFYNIFDPPPMLVSYQEFYHHLKRMVEEYIAEKEPDYQEQARFYLEAIKKRYCCIND